jgi:hypothetical protein
MNEQQCATIIKKMDRLSYCQRAVIQMNLNLSAILWLLNIEKKLFEGVSK